MVGKKIFVVPFLPGLNLPEEDGLGIDRRLVWEKEENPPSKDKKKRPVVVVVAYPHTAIADDVCPLEQDPRFIVQWRRRRIPRPYPHTTAVILPGSRLTRLDLKWMHDSGWGDFLRTHVASGGSVLGLCGGYQMLGWSVEDPTAVEGTGGSKLGLGLLPISTTIASAACKIVAPRKGRLLPSKIKVEGFELHCGRSEIITQAGAPINTQQIHPLVMFDDGKPEGMGSGKVKGTYLHGILRSAEARVQLLVPNPKDFPGLKKKVKDPLDRVAEHLASCGLDFETLKGMIGENQVEL